MTHLLKRDIEEIKDFILKQSIQSKKVLTLKEAALYLGISRSTLYKLTSSRTIPFYKPLPKLLFFNRDDLDQWLLRNRQATREEMAEGVCKRR